MWERGVGATLACGTGACAALVSSTLLGFCKEKAEVVLPGGSLYINWPNKQGSVYMTGPAEFVYHGQF